MDQSKSQQTGVRPNVELVRHVYEAFKRRNPAEIFSLFAPGIQITQSGEIPWGGKYNGQDEVLQFFSKLTQTIDSTVMLERFIDAGKYIVAIGRTQGVVNASGNKFDVPVAHVWTIENGLVARIEFHIDNPTMLAAFS